MPPGRTPPFSVCGSCDVKIRPRPEDSFGGGQEPEAEGTAADYAPDDCFVIEEASLPIRPEAGWRRTAMKK